MSLNLNARQRAMLAEMDVHVWGPFSGEEALLAVNPTDFDSRHATHNAIQSVAVDAYSTKARGQNGFESLAVPDDLVRTPAGRQGHTTAAVGRPATALAPLPGGIDAMDWSALCAAVTSCQACAMCIGRRAPVLAPVPAAADRLAADWLVLGEPPDDAQEHAGQPFVDDSGRLLDNMLKAVGVKRYQPGVSADPAHSAYLSLVLKCRPALPTAPDKQAVSRCANYLRREIALVQPKVILAMGRLAMHLLLSEDHPQGLKLPLGKLRGQVWHYQGVPVVVTYPPDYLLRNGQEKSRAWIDLCLAQQVLQGFIR